MSGNTIDLFRLDGQIAVVTGASGILGPYWVDALEGAGARVAKIDIRKPATTPQDFFAADITNPEDLKKIHSAIREKLGPVTILVNNAGIDAPPGAKVSEFGKMWQINVQGAVNCIEEFVPNMKKENTGSIVNIGSLYLDLAPDPEYYSHLDSDKPWAYGATKAALDSVTRHYAVRLAKSGIRINTLSPGGVFNNQDKEFVAKYSARAPMGRMADAASDLAGPLLFLASDASTYVTGINLRVNGGYTAR